MTRYFFDFRSDNTFSLDEEGVELPNIQAVHDEGVRALAEIIRDATVEGATAQRISIEARDRIGPVLKVTALLKSEIFRKN
jgi:hypothetical protein